VKEATAGDTPSIVALASACPSWDTKEAHGINNLEKEDGFPLVAGNPMSKLWSVFFPEWTKKEWRKSKSSRE
jgi:hypothetical protein